MKVSALAYVLGVVYDSGDTTDEHSGTVTIRGYTPS